MHWATVICDPVCCCCCCYMYAFASLMSRAKVQWKSVWTRPFCLCRFLLLWLPDGDLHSHAQHTLPPEQSESVSFAQTLMCVRERETLHWYVFLCLYVMMGRRAGLNINNTLHVELCMLLCNNTLLAIDSIQISYRYSEVTWVVWFQQRHLINKRHYRTMSIANIKVANFAYTICCLIDIDIYRWSNTQEYVHKNMKIIYFLFFYFFHFIPSEWK